MNAYFLAWPITLSSQAVTQLSETQDILGRAFPTTAEQIYAYFDKSHLKETSGKYRKSVEELGK